MDKHYFTLRFSYKTFLLSKGSKFFIILSRTKNARVLEKKTAHFH